MLQENYYSKNDFNDMIMLHQKTIDNPFINKVVSPFAVYMHSKLQFCILEAAHKRRKDDEEVLGHMDATGGVIKLNSNIANGPIMYYPLIMPLKGDENDVNHTMFAVTEFINSSHKVPDIAAWLFNFYEAFMQHNATILPIFDRILSAHIYIIPLPSLFGNITLQKIMYISTKVYHRSLLFAYNV